MRICVPAIITIAGPWGRAPRAYTRMRAPLGWATQHRPRQCPFPFSSFTSERIHIVKVNPPLVVRTHTPHALWCELFHRSEKSEAKECVLCCLCGGGCCVSIFIRLLHTLSMGAKTRARVTQERTVRLRYAQLLSLSSSVRGKLIKKIMGVTGSKGQCENVKSVHAHFL